ncbi:MAG: penicillin-binding protein 2 [Anaerolineae bacterium]|nr:penicillin-binding protein 2 [Anaerolineae bacterium]
MITYRQMFSRRLNLVVVVLVVVSLGLLLRLMAIQFQLDPDELAYLQGLASSAYTRLREYRPTRGQIYDRDGELLAVNTVEYSVGVSPSLITDPVEAARQLAVALNIDEMELYNILNTDDQWALLAPRVSAAVGQAVEDLDIYGTQVDPIPRRAYPQGSLAAQVLGFVNYDLQGYYGVEGRYQSDLAGESLIGEESNIPFEISASVAPRYGSDIVLTIDRDVQYLIEQTLAEAVASTGSEGGTIIVMNPSNGEILAMASYPTYDPNTFYELADEQLVNPAISEQYEPGSVFKVITMAAAIEEGVILPNSTYNDQASIQCGGLTIWNWDRQAHGLIDMTTALVQSLNVGASTVAIDMGPVRFYREVEAFGFGTPTRVDLQGEESGILLVPSSEGWRDGNLCTNSFGQGLAVTPLQMLTAINAIANGGLIMQPHVVYQIVDGDNVYTTQPASRGRPISTETARLIRDMMVQVVEFGVPAAQVEGYTIAGKTGTAEIPIPGGYEADSSIVTFVGFFPADDPQVSVLIKLDRPDEYWGSIVAAPIFSELAEQLAILLEIPPDAVRHTLTSQGGNVSAVDR